MKNFQEYLRETLSQSVSAGVMTKKQLEDILEKLRNTKNNILIVGSTGAGKSSTINTLFDMELAKVGTGTNSETKDIAKYELNNLIIWDTPGLGDTTQKDATYIKAIRHKLQEKDELLPDHLLIDLVLLIVDGSTRDMGTTYQLLDVIVPELHGDTDRLIVAINQADVAMKGKYWNSEIPAPEQTLIDFLEEKVKTVKNKIREDSGLDVNVMYYAAGFLDPETNIKDKPYNLGKLQSFILKSLKPTKRIALVEDLNKDKENFTSNDNKSNYKEDVLTSLKDGVLEVVVEFVKENAPKVLRFLASKVKTLIDGWLK